MIANFQRTRRSKSLHGPRLLTNRRRRRQLSRVSSAAFVAGWYPTGPCSTPTTQMFITRSLWSVLIAEISHKNYCLIHQFFVLLFKLVNDKRALRGSIGAQRAQNIWLDGGTYRRPNRRTKLLVEVTSHFKSTFTSICRVDSLVNLPPKPTGKCFFNPCSLRSFCFKLLVY